jgi:hypothetical protein
MMLSRLTDQEAPFYVVYSTPCYFLSLEWKDSLAKKTKVSEVKSSEHSSTFICFSCLIRASVICYCRSQTQFLRIY